MTVLFAGPAPPLTLPSGTHTAAGTSVFLQPALGSNAMKRTHTHPLWRWPAAKPPLPSDRKLQQMQE